MTGLLVLLLTACAPAQAPAEGPARAPVAATASTQATPPEAAPRAPVTVYDARVLRSYPHDTRAFTQGLFFADGVLYESTGQRGASVIRRLDLPGGGATAEVRLPDEVFGEGAAAVGDRIVSLTWQAGIGFVHDLETLALEGTFPVAGEGWGLAYDEAEDRLVLSDGTSQLRFLDPDTYEEAGGVEVTLDGRPLPRLNELEWLPAEGGKPARLLANVWQQDAIVEIDLDTGAVTGLIDVSALFPAGRRARPRDDVPNGVAYEPRSGRLFVTGKRWPELFEVELVPRG